MQQSKSDEADPQSTIRHKAFRLLARRDYSLKEMQQKFEREFDAADVAVVLQWLVAEGYQSDHRFCSSHVRNRMSQLQGLNKIRFDMRQKGVADDLLAQVLDEEAPDWFELARAARLRRFPCPDRTDRKLMAKVMRHLFQRGFAMDEARYALEVDSEEEN